ncbi:hypothetical protein GCM10022631_04760 [Deinococcus rubellus]|uniref:Uncharacterized protein n=1 Tax=Deinococcus rubellus TaxID=1889240 RepID=A0ABY5YHK3_9DEIO|nr:hypothetical protein [Deinococcus rubellus]UWX64171.1 hypothetical protein N0D28_00370 [Deinococcus rubellus]
MLLAVYLLGLLLFRRWCGLLTPEQAVAVSVLQAVLMLTIICALLNPSPTEVDHETE